MTRSLVSALVGALALVTTAAPALANGRYPGAQFLTVGPGTDRSTLALQTTFGLLMSTDGGTTWRWVCEQAEGFAAMADPALALQRDGSLIITLPDGISVGGAPYCDFTRPATVPLQQVIDATTDPNGTRSAIAVTPISGTNAVWISDDLGQHWAAGWSLANLFIETIDIAPGHPDRMYLSGYAPNAVPTIYRSDNGGQMFAPTTTDLMGGYDAFIAAVDPSNPDVLYVRSDVSSGGTMLLRSADGGMNFTMVARTMARMTGAAISPDGVHVWIAGRGGIDGVLRSDDHGLTFHQVSNPFTTLCLRYQAGFLFACTDYNTDGFALACSTDMGATFIPILSFTDVQESTHCPAGSGVTDRCASLWPTQRDALLADAGMRPPTCSHDGGCPDAGSDASMDASPTDVTAMDDASGFDAALDAARDSGAPADASINPPRTGCACRTDAPTGGARDSAIVLALTIAALALKRRNGSRNGDGPA